MTDTTIPTTRYLEFGLNAAVPVGATFAWGARAICDWVMLKNGKFDIPYDRKSTFGLCSTMLQHLLKADALTASAQKLHQMNVENRGPADTSIHIVYDDGVYQIAAKNSGGYIYLAAFAKPKE
jgi:hypothetical protein